MCCRAWGYQTGLMIRNVLPQLSVSFPLLFMSLTSLNALSDKMQNKLCLVSMWLHVATEVGKLLSPTIRGARECSSRATYSVFPVGTILVIHTWSWFGAKRVISASKWLDFPLGGYIWQIITKPVICTCWNTFKKPIQPIKGCISPACF